jgi:hypothetical protein
VHGPAGARVTITITIAVSIARRCIRAFIDVAIVIGLFAGAVIAASGEQEENCQERPMELGGSHLNARMPLINR